MKDNQIVINIENLVKDLTIKSSKTKKIEQKTTESVVKALNKIINDAGQPKITVTFISNPAFQKQMEVVKSEIEKLNGIEPLLQVLT